MLDKVVKYASYAMAIILGLIANRIIVILKVFTGNEQLSNIIGFIICIMMFILWKIIDNKYLSKNKDDKSNWK